MIETIENPIIRGYHPDPSICRVGDTFYLVNSTFEFFPGVPIYKSHNLRDWTLIGHCLTRESQLSLQNCPPSGGIFAPTIRYHNHLFYMITTNVTDKGNFIVHSADPSGEWSDPVWIDHRGIDPSLLFDEDGTVYYCGTGEDDNGKQGIVCFILDPINGNILSEKKIICYGSGGKFPEGPHLYHLGSYYYLMIAEGGTEYGHMETMFRSHSVWGPYEACPHNPILSNRYEMYNDIQCTGHADICNDENGNWWLVCLGIRKLPSGQMLHNLGRETFLTSFYWNEDRWPVLANHGTIKPALEAELPAVVQKSKDAYFSDNFRSSVINPEWSYIRNPEKERYEIGNGELILKGSQNELSDYRPTFLGVRQTEFNQSLTVTLSAELQTRSAKAGITAFYSMDNHYDLFLTREKGYLYVNVSRHVLDLERVTARLVIPEQTDITLRIISDCPKIEGYGSADYNYIFQVLVNDRFLTLDYATAAGLCTEGTQKMTFTGTFFGVFAVSSEAHIKYFDISKIK